MREQAWAKADARREQAAAGPSLAATVRRVAMSFARLGRRS